MIWGVMNRFGGFAPAAPLLWSDLKFSAPTERYKEVFEVPLIGSLYRSIDDTRELIFYSYLPLRCA